MEQRYKGLEARPGSRCPCAHMIIRQVICARNVHLCASLPVTRIVCDTRVLASPPQVCPQSSEMGRVPKAEHRSTQLPAQCLPCGPGAASLLPAQSWSNCPLLWAPGTPPLSAVLQRALSAGRLCVYGNLPETVCTAASSTLAAFEIWELAPCWVEDRAALYLVEVPGKAPD